MMKNLLIVFTVLTMASAANAALFLSVDGVENPPDTSIEIMPSDVVIIDITGDGQTPIGEFFLGVMAGDPGALNIDNAVIPYPGNATGIDWFDDSEIAEILGVDNPFVGIALTDVAIPPKPLTGLLVDLIEFHCEAEGDVTLTLFDGEGNPLDTQVIHQIPEPITFALLGLGGLFLRRRK